MMKKLSPILLISLLLFSCKKEQPPHSLQEDCGCAKEVNADFLMEEMSTVSTSDAHYSNTDTIYAGKNVRFTALEENAEYTWILGAETINDKQFTRFFDTTLAGQTIPVLLIVKKQPNLICFPNDDGIDTISKNLYVSKKNWFNFFSETDNCFEGKFRLKEKNTIDSIDVDIYVYPDGELGIDGYDNPNRFLFVNLFGNNELRWGSPDFGFLNYREVWLNIGTGPIRLKRRDDKLLEIEITGQSLYYYLGRKL